MFTSPKLTWRDVQHVIVRSARPAPGGVLLANGFWAKNEAGLAVSKFYGFGLMDAGEMVHLAKQWNTVPEQRTCEVSGTDTNRYGVFVVVWGTRVDVIVILSLRTMQQLSEERGSEMNTI